MKKGMMLFVSWMILLFQLPWYDYSSVYAEEENTAKVISIAAGGNHSLALKEDGTVWAWGWNKYGQLGDGTNEDHATPVQTKDITNVISIAAGYSHSLTLKKDGTVWAWGYNEHGQLGDGTKENRATPVQVKDLTDVVAIAAGSSHSLALKKDGTVWAWGNNNKGELGDGTVGNERITPVRVQNLTDVVAIAAGYDHSLALKQDGTVWAWGWNYDGQLGDGTEEDRTTPVQVQNLRDVVAIAAGGIAVGGYHSLALKRNGTVWAWGSNSSGQLGDGTWEDRATPIQVQNLTDIVAIAAGGGHSLALKRDGTAWAWGYNGNGELGDGTMEDGNTPLQIKNLNDVIAIAAGDGHSLALKQDGTVWAWGDNRYGQLGGGTKGEHVTSVQIQYLTDVDAIIAGGSHSLALKRDRTVWAWGYNGHGQLGDGTWEDRATPIQVQNLTDIVAIAAGGNHSLVLKQDGTVWAWGQDTVYEGSKIGLLKNGRFGMIVDRTTDQITPVQVQNIMDVIAIAAGNRHSLALKRDGTVWAWGYNGNGELGDGTTVDNPTPVQVKNLTDVTAIAAGGGYSLALKRDGTVWAWGSNYSHQFSDEIYGLDPHSTTPVQVKNLTDVVAIAAGYDHSLALKQDGTVWAWGSNTYGNLGDGKKGDERATPVRVQNLTDVIAIAARGGHSIALKKDGTVWAWGWNRWGQLGDGTKEDRPTPVQVKNLTDVAAIANGTYHSIALKKDGTVWAWGNNENGQLGDGTFGFRTTPGLVKGLTTFANGKELLQLDSPVPIQITNQQPAEQVHAVPKNVAPLSDAYTVTSAAPLAKETKLTIKVDPAKLAGVDPYKVAIWKFIETPSTGKREQTTQTAALNGYWESIGGKVDLSTSSVSSYITEYGTYAVMLSNQTIADIQDHPYKYEIEVLLAQGIIKGYSETEFRPDQGISRAEFAKVIVKAAHYPLGNENAAFKDVPNGHWATRYIEAAQRAGAIKGYSATQFMPNNLISREQAVTIVGRAGQLGTLNSQEIEAQLKGYPDGTSISDYARGYFAEAIKRNMIADQEGSLQPQKPVTRAVIAKMIMALMIRLGYL